MKIKSIELKNFKPFKGDNNKFDFDSDDHEPVILVKANNGSGKTSLLQALKWAFYGIGGIAYYKTNQQEMVNRVAKTEGDGETSVKVVFQHDEHSYTLKRSYKFSKTNNWNEDPRVYADRFTIDIDGQPEVDSIDKQKWDVKAIESFVDGILPQDASQFFFFDGEMIRGYTQEPQKPRVKESIQMVLGIQELLNARTDFKEELIPEYGRLLSNEAKKEGETHDLGEKAATVEEEIEGIQKKVEAYESRIDNVETAIENYKKDLAENKESAGKAKARDDAVTAISDIEKEELANTDEKRDFNPNLAALFIAPFIKILNENKPNTITRKWEIDAAARIKEKKNCLCGNPIDSKAIAHLEQFTTNGKNSGTGLILDEADKITARFGTDMLQERFERIRNTTIEIQNKKVTAKENLEKIKKDIGESVITGFDVGKCENDLEVAEKNKEEYNRQKSELTGKLETKGGDLSSLQSKISKLTKGTKANEYRMLLEQAKKVHEATDTAIRTLVNSKRKMIEKNTSEIFLQMTNTPDHFKGITIDDEYRFSLVHRDGEAISTHKAGASAGQNQIIASAFIAALNKLSAREASIVIDTPLGRLDDLHSTNMIKYYPKFKPQVIILYQPKELGSKDSQDAIQTITPHIHSEYEITADPLDENISTIERIK